MKKEKNFTDKQIDIVRELFKKHHKELDDLEEKQIANIKRYGISIGIPSSDKPLTL